MSSDLVLVVLQQQTEAPSHTISSYTKKGLTFAVGMTRPSLTTSIHPAADPMVIAIPIHPVPRSIYPANCRYPSKYIAPQTRSAAVKALMVSL